MKIKFRQILLKTTITSLLLFLSVNLLLISTVAIAAPNDKTSSVAINHNSDLPTTITADTLSLDSTKRYFLYTNNVKVVQGDMTLTCERLEGYYDQNNEITKLNAFEDVVILKGEKIEARSEKAVYIAATQVATLTENPRIIQGNSALVADVVKVFLETDKTLAEGKVQMKIVKEVKNAGNQSLQNQPNRDNNTRKFGG